MTATYSSVTRPRSSKAGRLSPSNSSRIHPAPMPTTTRPPDSTSVVASDLAMNTGLRCGTTMTEVSSRTRSVIAANHDSSVNCSMQSVLPSAVQANSPLSL
ncbi:MAG: hypothetical protein R2755_10825 [Acidimicrobiales bacterium]